jgi:hypothetical protein
MKPVLLLLPFLTLVSTACTGPAEAPSCHGEVFQLNPSRMVPLTTLAAGPPAASTTAAAPVSAGSAIR